MISRVFITLTLLHGEPRGVMPSPPKKRGKVRVARTLKMSLIEVKGVYHEPEGAMIEIEAIAAVPVDRDAPL
jgi:hypothetical protein